ncbi:unnamed protein product [Plutella xylostella]|uniref:(diamondback moth) hypothetical protein n=1 Tax=Plutella xylostella TaxID=51655 RepID=A0A8S4F0M3_PLUXY|nr:unnamed protein product [Plutella xylostella]
MVIIEVNPVKVGGGFEVAGIATVAILMLLTSASSAPLPRTLGSLVSGDTLGLELPTALLAGAGAGAVQVVVNVYTDSTGNIQVDPAVF